MASKGQLTGMRGVYLVAAELAKHGFIASPTSRSAAGADLLVTNQSCTKTFSVQVKANASAFGWFLVGRHAVNFKARNHIYVLVNLRPKETEFYVVPSFVAAGLIEVADRRASTWYAIRCKNVKKFRDKWEKVFGKA